MRKLFIAAALFVSASAATLAFAQTKPNEIEPMITQPAETLGNSQLQTSVPDARSLASDQQVGEARRAYRNACNRYESPGFCDCVTAGVAQALMPDEVRIAARTIGERINAQGDAAMSSDSDAPPEGASSSVRIEQVEGHYADACHQFRRS